MDHANNVEIQAIDFVPQTLIDAEIYGDQDTLIGRVSHVHGLGAASQIVVDVGGFLGIGSKSVMLKATDLVFMRDDNGRVHGLTSWTKEQVKALPEHAH